jgi:hypothetical protein
MTAMKQQKLNDGFRGLFLLGAFYTLWPKHTRVQTWQCCRILVSRLCKVWGSTHLIWKVKFVQVPTAWGLSSELVCT